MKLKITLLLLICFSKIYSQKITKEIGEIKITKEEYYFEDHKKSKKRKTEKAEFYFDNFGEILEKITFGRNHYNKLNVVGKIEQYFYLNGNLKSEKNWIIGCGNNDFTLYETEYVYDEQNILTKQIFSNPISTPFIYKYEKNKTEIHFGDYYNQEIFDEQKRIIQFNQISEETNKIRWQYLYEYQENCRIANFQTYYGDGKENSKKEIAYFDNKNRIISNEIIDFSKIKIVYKYSENGIINEIEEYEKITEYKDYELSRLTKIKMNSKSDNLTTEIVKKINSKIM